MIYEEIDVVENEDEDDDGSEHLYDSDATTQDENEEGDINQQLLEG